MIQINCYTDIFLSFLFFRLVKMSYASTMIGSVTEWKTVRKMAEMSGLTSVIINAFSTSNGKDSSKRWNSSIDQYVNQWMNESIIQSMNIWINQSINHWSDKLISNSATPPFTYMLVSNHRRCISAEHYNQPYCMNFLQLCNGQSECEKYQGHNLDRSDESNCTCEQNSDCILQKPPTVIG